MPLRDLQGHFLFVNFFLKYLNNNNAYTVKAVKSAATETSATEAPAMKTSAVKTSAVETSTLKASAAHTSTMHPAMQARIQALWIHWS
jgi:hypothetical protein